MVDLSRLQNGNRNDSGKEGNWSPQVKTATKEKHKEVSDHTDTVIVNDIDEEEEHYQLDNNGYTKRETFGQYINYGYTSQEHGIDESGIDTDNTVHTKQKTDNNNSSNQSTRDVPNDISNDKEAT